MSSLLRKSGRKKKKDNKVHVALAEFRLTRECVRVDGDSWLGNVNWGRPAIFLSFFPGGGYVLLAKFVVCNFSCCQVGMCRLLFI